jgi:hypothetical protein
MERSFVWFVTDHKPNVDIFDMKTLQTTSTSRSNLRLQTWGIYDPQLAYLDDDIFRTSSEWTLWRFSSAMRLGGVYGFRGRSKSLYCGRMLCMF